MFTGELLAIYTSHKKGDGLHAVAEAELVAGGGLRDDRYFVPAGQSKPEQEVTLLESEALEALGREYDITLTPAQVRRNLLTRGVPLNHLVGQEFAVGDVVLAGIRLCEPCQHLEGMTATGVMKGLRHRGGLRARVVRGGVVRPGAAIRPVT
jgi:MOSC domain-containing protein YiiM